MYTLASRSRAAHTALVSQLYSHPPDLHSFPTRRSSDLAMNARAREMGLREPLKLQLLQDGAHNFGGLVRRDRKSTRLNSSHEWISYAVFCLKKKKDEKLASLTPTHRAPNARQKTIEHLA